MLKAHLLRILLPALVLCICYFSFNGNHSVFETLFGSRLPRLDISLGMTLACKWAVDPLNLLLFEN